MKIITKFQFNDDYLIEIDGNEAHDGCYLKPNEEIFWIKDSRYHNENGPARAEKNGNIWWCDCGWVRRNDNTGGPSFESGDGVQIWTNSQGQVHREEGPAILTPDHQYYMFRNVAYLSIQNDEEWASFIEDHSSDCWFKGGAIYQNHPSALKEAKAAFEEYSSWRFGGVYNGIHFSDAYSIIPYIGESLEEVKTKNGWLFQNKRVSFYDYFLDDKEVIVDGNEISYSHRIIYQSEDGSEPSYILKNGDKFLVDDRGIIHCEDGPAVKYSDGTEGYYFKGILYPAITNIKEWGTFINNNKGEAWFDLGIDGPHITEGETKLTTKDGSVIYYQNGKPYTPEDSDTQEVLHILKGTSKNPFRNGTLKKEGYFRYRGQALRDYKELD